MPSLLDIPAPPAPATRSREDVPHTTRSDKTAATLAAAAAATALVAAVFSAFVVNVSDSVHTFHAGVASEAWGLSGMSLGLAVALLTAGALGDDLGHQRVLRFSAAGLAAASMLGAVAPSMAILVTARVLQGIAGGGVLASSLGAIGQTFSAEPARTRATSVWGAAVGGGVAVGPLGGAACAAVLGWRRSFWVEAAGALAVMAATAALTAPRTTARRPLDLPGIVTLGAAMALVTAALVESHYGWTAGSTPILLSAAALMMGAWVIGGLRSRHTLLDPRLFTQPRFLASISGALFTGLAVVGLMSYAPALMQTALHLSALASAAVLLAWSATSMVVAFVARYLPKRLSAQARLLIGLAAAGAGELALSDLSTRTGWTGLVPGLFVTGIGTGLVNAALGKVAVDSVPGGRAGLGSGANSTARYLGGATGAALVISIAASAGSRELIAGWNAAALVSAGLCALGVTTIAACRTWRQPDQTTSIRRAR